MNSNSNRATFYSRTKFRNILIRVTTLTLLTSIFSAVGNFAVAPKAQADLAATCSIGSAAQGNIAVEPSQPTVMYIDSGVNPRIDAAYIGYRIKNTTGATLKGYWASVTNFTGGVVSLANPLDKYIAIPDLANNASTSVYFLVKATGATKVAQKHDFQIWDEYPDASTKVNKYGCTFAFNQVAETIKASANKPDAPVVSTIGDVGTTFTVTASGASGTIGAGSAAVGKILWFTPTAYSNFPTRSFRLESVTLKIADNNALNTSGSNKLWTYKERLYVKTDTVPETGIVSGSQSTANPLTSKMYYENVYTFRVIAPGTGTIAPQAQISSGTQIKHSGTIPTASINGSTAKLPIYISKTIDTTTANLGNLPKVTISGTLYVEVPYKITLTETGTITIRVDQVVDVPPSGSRYKAGSSQVSVGGATKTTISDPETFTSEAALNPQPLHFIGPFDVPGTSPKTVDIYYKMYIPAVKGTYRNEATAYIGDTQIISQGSVSLPGVNLTVNDSGTVTTYETVTVSLDPVALTSPPSSIDTSTATLNGSVDPNNDTQTVGYFEWGTSPTLATYTSINLSSITGSSPVSKSSNLTGLTPNTNYYYRIVAVSGTTRYEGAILNFTTLVQKASPTVTTDPPSGVSGTDATLNATVNANLNSVSLQFLVWRTNDTTTVTMVDDPSTSYNLSSNPYSIFSGGFSSNAAINMTDAAYSLSSKISAGVTIYYIARIVDSANIGTVLATGTTQSFKMVTYTDQTITFSAISDITYGSSISAITPTASSGMVVTMTSNTTSVCTVDSSGNITILKIGTCSITASQPGGLKPGTSSYYNPATDVTQQFEVNPKPITVTAVAKTKVYGDSDPSLTYSVSNTLVGSDTFTGTISRTTGASVGTYTINQNTLALNSNYTLTYNSANFTITKRPITITAANKTKVYGDADPPLTYSLTSGSIASGDALATVVTGALTRTSGSNVGTYSIDTGTVTASSNYQLTFVQGTFSITEKPITVKADAKSRKQSDPSDPALTYSITSGGLVGSDTFTGTIARDAGTAVGTYPIRQGTLAISPTPTNYTFTFINDTFTITDKTIPVLVWSNPAAITYGETLTATQLNAFIKESNSDPTVVPGSCVYTPALGALLTPGTQTLSVTCTPTNTSTYSSVSGTVTIVVNPRPITIKADSKTKAYGASDPSLTYSVTVGSLVGSDSLSGSLSRTAGEAVGTYAISRGTVDNAYYTITYTGDSLTVTALTITVTAEAKSKYYGEDDPSLTYTYTGTLVGSDDFTGSISRATGTAVGTYAIGRNTLALSSNYTLVFNGATFTIQARPITITADNKSKNYGDSDPSLTYSLTSGTFATGDSLGSIVSGSLTRAAGTAVGTYSITIGSVAASSNYSLTFNAGTLTINQRSITVTADDKTKNTTDTDPAFTYTINSGTLVSPDTFSGSLTRASLGTNTVGDYAITQGTLALSSNYSLSFNNGTLTITNKIIPVLVWNNPAAITYGETLTATQLNAWVKRSNSDSTTVTSNCVYSPALGTLLSAGTHTLSVTCTPTDTATYSAVSGTVSLVVNPLTLTFSVTAANKQYDGDTSASITVGSLAGVLSGDSGNVGLDSSKVTGAFTTKTVGNSKIVTLTLGSPLLSGSAKDNYSVTTPSNPTANITKAPLNVTANDVTVAAGSSLPSISYTLGSLLGSDSGDPFTGISCTSNYSTSDSAGTSRYTRCSGGVATNYDPVHIDGTVTITSAPVTYTITYTAGGGSGTVPTQSSLSSGQSFVLASGSGLSRGGYNFTNWSCNSTTKEVGSSFTVGSSNVTCVAQWSLIGGGGSGNSGNSPSNVNNSNSSNSAQARRVGQVRLVTISTTAVKEIVDVLATTPSPSPTPTAASRPSATPTPSASPTPAASARPTSSPTASASVAPSATPTPSTSSRPGATPTPAAPGRPTPSPTPSVSPSATPSANSSSSGSPSPSRPGALPSPSAPGRPSASPSPTPSAVTPAATPTENPSSNGNSASAQAINGVQLSQTTVIPVSGTKSITFSGVGIAKVALKDDEVSVQAKPGFSGKTTVTINLTSQNEQVEKIIAEVLVLPEPPKTPVVRVLEKETTRISWKRSINANGYEVKQGDEVLCTSKTTMCTLKKAVADFPPVTIKALGRDNTQSTMVNATYEVAVRATEVPEISLVVNFDTARFNLDEGDRARIRAFAADVVKFKYTEVDITGHTDARGGVDNNVLSLNRAKAAADYLLKLVPTLKVTVGGYASTINVADNTTAEGLAANRRAEFRVVERLVTMTKQVPYTPPAP